MQDNLAADYVLVNDIDAGATRTWNEVAGFTGRYYGFKPVGWDTIFSGTFDGQGYTISNLYINRTTEYGTTPDGYGYTGLFGKLSSATAGDFVKDVSILNADITGGNTAVGILAGWAGVSTVGGAGTLDISNVATSGTVRVAIGIQGGAGVVGRASDGTDVTFTDCSSSASINITSTTWAAAAIILGGFGGGS